VLHCCSLDALRMGVLLSLMIISHELQLFGTKPTRLMESL